MALYYCKRCGRIALKYPNKAGQIDDPCACCGAKVYPVPQKYWLDGENFMISDDQEELLREELVKPSPEFDQYLFEHRDEIIARKTMEYEAIMERGKAILEGRDKGNKFGIECPYCHATNVRKITAASKAVHTAMFGIFSMGRNTKNYHCDHCGADF